MLSWYLQWIAKRSTAALVAAGRGMPYPNPAAARLIEGHPGFGEAVAAELAGAIESRRASRSEIGGVSLAFLPLFDRGGDADAALACVVEEADIPGVLQELQGGMRFFNQIVHVLPAIVVTARPSGEFDYFSRRWFETVVDAGKPATTSFFEGIAQDDSRDASRDWHDGIRSGAEFTLEFRLRTVEGERWYELSVKPLRTTAGSILKWVGLLTDVDMKVTARTKLGLSERRFHILSDLGKAIAGSGSLTDMARQVCSIGTAQSEGTWFCEASNGGETVAYPPSFETFREAVVVGLGDEETRTFAVAGPEGKPATATATGIVQSGSRIGFLGLVREGSLTDVTPERELLLREVALRMSLALERLHANERDRAIAETLQRAMLPLALPQSFGVELDVAYEAAETDTLVGGDWYDAFALGDGRIAITIGDVAGHGLEASLIMAQVRQAMRVAAMENPNPASVLAVANRLVMSERHPLVTAHFGVLDPLSIRYVFAAAGHPPPIFVDGDGLVRTLATSTMPLGVREDLQATSHAVDLERNAALVLYTDGVIEDSRDILAGERRLRECLHRWALGGFEARASELQSRMRTGFHRDDAAMFVLRFPKVEEFDVELKASLPNARRLRKAAQDFIAGAGFRGEKAFDAGLAVGEAINNAVEHAYRERKGNVRVTLRREGDVLVAAVRDHGTWRRPAPGSGDRGRGLGLVRALAQDVEIVPDAKGTSVRFRVEFDRDEQPPAGGAVAPRSYGA